MAHPVVLSDASPLIALALIDRLNLLHSLFGEVLITEGEPDPAFYVVLNTCTDLIAMLASPRRRLPR